MLHCFFCVFVELFSNFIPKSSIFRTSVSTNLTNNVTKIELLAVYYIQKFYFKAFFFYKQPIVIIKSPHGKTLASINGPRA